MRTESDLMSKDHVQENSEYQNLASQWPQRKITQLGGPEHVINKQKAKLPASISPARQLQCQEGPTKHNNKTANRTKHENGLAFDKALFPIQKY